MRIQEIHERSIPLSRYAGVAAAAGGLSTSLVAVRTDVVRDGRRVVGYGHASVGRYAQGGLIRERFAPRLLAAPADSLLGDDGGIDPFRAWSVMMRDEKPGGHGERCVAVGALDMALWDAAAKAAGLPLHRFLARRLGLAQDYPRCVPVYASGGYPYPHDDLARLEEELRRFVDLGYTHAKIKIGAAGLDRDLRRIDTALRVLGDASRLAVDAMNRYDAGGAVDAAKALAPLGLWWFEDICDPHDFPTQAAVAAFYPGPIAAGEALFSLAEARLLDAYGGLRRERDVLLFDPVHCYGLPGYLAILDALCARGWPRSAFRPHAGQLFSLHLVAALRLGWAEANPLAFQPLDGLAAAQPLASGLVGLPEAPGIGFELQPALGGLFRELLEA
ncbi:TPA: mandelate racemase [Pseudomonas aeruginosa]|nr:mandelate racemase [Pseudomonas aeruginosa]HBN8236817.1 mandelate racemase [Pseudomonas aeruginosa]